MRTFIEVLSGIAYLGIGTVCAFVYSLGMIQPEDDEAKRTRLAREAMQIGVAWPLAVALLFTIAPIMIVHEKLKSVNPPKPPKKDLRDGHELIRNCGTDA